MKKWLLLFSLLLIPVVPAVAQPPKLTPAFQVVKFTGCTTGTCDPGFPRYVISFNAEIFPSHTLSSCRFLVSSTLVPRSQIHGSAWLPFNADEITSASIYYANSHMFYKFYNVITWLTLKQSPVIQIRNAKALIGMTLYICAIIPRDNHIWISNMITVQLL
jgi:hypothetical protein